jgi:hypothetical protein
MPAYLIIPSSSSVPLGTLTSSTNHGSLAEQTSKVVFVISLPNFIETEHKKQRKSGKGE